MEDETCWTYDDTTPKINVSKLAFINSYTGYSDHALLNQNWKARPYITSKTLNYKQAKRWTNTARRWKKYLPFYRSPAKRPGNST